MNLFKLSHERLSDTQKRKLEAKQERSVAKLVKINVIFNRTVPTSSTSQQDIMPGIDFSQVSVMDSDQEASEIVIKFLKSSVHLLFVSLVVKKSTEAILLAKMLESTVKSTYFNF